MEVGLRVCMPDGDGDGDGDGDRVRVCMPAEWRSGSGLGLV